MPFSKSQCFILELFPYRLLNEQVVARSKIAVFPSIGDNNIDIGDGVVEFLEGWEDLFKTLPWHKPVHPRISGRLHITCEIDLAFSRYKKHPGMVSHCPGLCKLEGYDIAAFQFVDVFLSDLNYVMPPAYSLIQDALVVLNGFGELGQHVIPYFLRLDDDN